MIHSIILLDSVVYQPAPPVNPLEWTGEDFPTLSGDVTVALTGTTTSVSSSRRPGAGSRQQRSLAAIVSGTDGGGHFSNDSDDFPSLPTTSSNTSNAQPGK